MSEKIFSVFCLIILASCSATGQIWYKHVNCFDNGFVVNCEIPKTVVTPINQPPFWYPNVPSVVNNFPQQINQPLLPLNQEMFTGDQRSPTDPILASPFEIRAINPCRPDQFSCSSPHQCIEKKQQCDGQVNCVDGSDEINCSCISRIDPSKICDNYFDCPDGIDEVGCFGCKSDSYSCHNNENEYIKDNRQAKCYAITEKCDSYADCVKNGKDEEDCLLLAPKKKQNPDPFVRSTEGFLYKNYKNEWYPVCEDLLGWTKQVCQMEQGIDLRLAPTVSYQHFTYSGKYITSVKNYAGMHPQAIVNSCSIAEVASRNAILHVKCPEVCGQQFPFENKNHQSMRISGGKEAAAGAHPWLVSLHLNGTFVCGGSIIDRKWIATAAHCLMKRNHQTVGKYDYMEVRAGILRQDSFTPHEQTVRVSNVSMHVNFDRETLVSDIALLELKEPLQFNRWVQPICLPTRDRIISDGVPNWTEKYENITCLAAGWGDFTFRGSSVENVMEVELPIVPDCDPANPGAFCAGYTEGGFDTCYGDSGGPFVCQSEQNGTNFFLAGITSYGYNPTKADKNEVRCGEPNSYSVFTRMSMFSPYIEDMKADEFKTPLRENCPGRRCRYNKRCVGAVNGIVECLSGEDEVYRMEERRND